ncbi:c-type cytochrome biogenesis protein CcmI [Thiorhodovibrio frisius]|uniref:Cytochrome c-type biogenesis protein CcmI n=1 Tax=Thiorhodovibrio frisius TaxID=631362 RepID=H8Z7Q1_9GAMM|nr:c-type cytochrome biogenesis protein CcmI [Thiorhodovibrio frisius]EIC19904.1 cytochrome c-type biogenesis protein CcmI [Thiorhodovibrio frisius]WPL20632.1 Cytochrome c-type biogenesis protein CcmH precursor [Thiorhodovibrio frisius]
MTLFWTLAGAMLVLAAFFVLVPLWRARTAIAGQADAAKANVTQDAVNLGLFRQQLAELDVDLANGKIDAEQHQAARLELERELLHDLDDAGASSTEHATRGRWLLPLLALAIPALAVAFYQATGTPDIIPRLAQAGATQSIPGHGGDGEMPPLDELANRLAARMEQNPGDIEGWVMLGRTYFALGNAPGALHALERAYALAPDDLDVKLTYAEALAANNNNNLEGQPAELISQVLAADPNHINARWLTGMLSFQRGQYSAAIQSWQRILDQTAPNSGDAEDLRGLIEEARKRGGVVAAPASDQAPAAAEPQQRKPSEADQAATGADKPAPQAPASAQTGETSVSEETTSDADKPAAPGARVQVSVSIAPELSDQLPPDAVVFVYAKAAAGPPMPLAAQRLRVGDLPATLTLDDSMAMNPAMTLSNFPKVILGARISLSGQAMPMSGDLQGESGPIATSAAQAAVPVVINQRLP